MSGSATRADVVAGEALGRQVASVFAARARTDKAGVAGGNPDYWNSLVTNTQARGETPWSSLETPKTPAHVAFVRRSKNLLVRFGYKG